MKLTHLITACALALAGPVFADPPSAFDRSLPSYQRATALNEFMSREDSKIQRRLSNQTFGTLRNLERLANKAYAERRYTEDEWSRAINNIARAKGEKQRDSRDRNQQRGNDPSCSGCSATDPNGPY